MTHFVHGQKMEVHDCPICNIVYAAPENFFQRKNEKGEGWKCPNGHGVEYCESDLQKATKKTKILERALESSRNCKATVVRELKRTKHTLRTTKGHVTRLKNKTTEKK